jgi:hypothetical protein
MPARELPARPNLEQYKKQAHRPESTPKGVPAALSTLETPCGTVIHRWLFVTRQAGLGADPSLPTR